MTTRATLYRCHLFSFGGPQTAGVESRWTQDLEPIGDAEVLTGDVVELYVTVDGGAHALSEESRIRFDILEEDFLLTGGSDDAVLSIVGTGASAAESEFPTAQRTTVFRHLPSSQSLRTFVDEYRRANQSSYVDQILVVEETAGDGKRHHLLTWWTAERKEDFGAAEMYFVVNVDDTLDDKSDEVLNVSADTAPSESDAPGMPWGAHSALRRIHRMIGAGEFTWSASADEARMALRTLKALPPEALVRTVLIMKVAGTWQPFARAVKQYEPMDFVLVEMLLDPDGGYLMPGDDVEVKVLASGDLERDLSGKFNVRSDGVRLPLLGESVNIIGLLPSDAAKAIARAYAGDYLVDPTASVTVLARRYRFGDEPGPSGRVEWSSGLVVDPNSPDQRRYRKLATFTAYVAPLRDRDGRTATALIHYYDWIATNRESPEFLARAPDDLWSWALARAYEPPPETPLARFVGFMHTMTAHTDRLPADERRERMATAERFARWIDEHKSGPDLQTADPVDVWVELASAVWRAEIEEKNRRIEAAIRNRPGQIDWDAVGRKIDRAIALMMRTVWRLPEPYTIESKRAGVGYLIMASELEAQVRDMIAREFLDDVLRAATSETFSQTTAEADFTNWLHARPELLYLLGIAYAHPYTEQYDVEIELEAWQTAVEVGIGFIPIVGQVVAAYEVISGESLFGRPLSTAERAIIGALILLPAAAKLFKVGRSVVSASQIAREYNLGAREANALYRAAFPVRPGTVGEKLLNAAFGDLKAGKSLRDRDTLSAFEPLLREMGFFERATAQSLGVTEGRALLGAELAGVQETKELLAKLVGDEARALRGFDALSSEAKVALRAAARRERDFLRFAVRAEEQQGLRKHLDELVNRLRQADMPEAQAAELRKAIDMLNRERRLVLASPLGARQAERVAELADRIQFEKQGEHWVVELRDRVVELGNAGKTDAARELERRITRIADYLKRPGGAQAEADALRAAVVANPALAARVAEGAGPELRRLWIQYRLNPNLKSTFAEYVGILERHYRGNLGEFELAFRLGESHVILKPPDALVTVPGTDVIAIPRGGGRILYIDNKALVEAQITDVSALTRNLPNNLLKDIDEFGRLAGATDVPAHLKLALNRMTRARDELQAAGLLGLGRDAMRDPTVQQRVTAILAKHDIDLVVSNAAGQVTSISADLRAIGLDVLDLNAPVVPPPSSAPVP